MLRVRPLSQPQMSGTSTTPQVAVAGPVTYKSVVPCVILEPTWLPSEERKPAEPGGQQDQPGYRTAETPERRNPEGDHVRDELAVAHDPGPPERWWVTDEKARTDGPLRKK